MTSWWRGSVPLLVALLLAGDSRAQGIPTATLSGRVHGEGLALPGVSVSATSPGLQGTRVTATGAAGDYALVNVPPGEYLITFALPGLQRETRAVKLAASQVSRLDVTLSLTPVLAETTVEGASESISRTTTEATTYTSGLLASLPTARTIRSAVVLSPGVGPGGLSISGAETNESLYTLNGVVITDNVTSQPYNLYVEDAIQETTTMTSAISAEYGRFTGGVVNTITKSGGNSFSGSFRTNFADNAWSATSGYRVPSTGVNPQEGTFTNRVTEVYEATFGGPILKDRIWFFGAGRFYDTTNATTVLTAFTNIPVTQGTREARYEGKLTFSPFQGHTLTGSYTGVDTMPHNYTQGAVADPALYYDPKMPQSIAVINYSGVLTNALSLEAFYSRRRFTYKDYGSRLTDLVGGTPVRDTALGVWMNSPVFCGVCDPETRDNDDTVIKATYFLETRSLGAHAVVAGADSFGGQRKSNNYQSGSNFVLYTATASHVVGQSIYPVFDSSSYLVYWPILQLSQGNDLKTQSAFLNDTWRPSDRLSLNLGVRYDRNHAVDQGGNLTSDDSAWSPRLAATFDVKGDGDLRVTASYAKYVSALQDRQAGTAGTLAGAPALFYWYFDGPGASPINAGGPPYVSAADGVKQVFDWFGSRGCLPDPTAASCTVPLGGPPTISGVNVQVKGSLASPNAVEYLLGLSGSIGKRGTFRADVVRREYHDYYDLRRDRSTGTVASPVNPSDVYDLGLIVNSDDYTRNYTGLHAQLAYRPTDRLAIGGAWTWSHSIGDLEGTKNTFGSAHDYPEYQDRTWSSPVGSLSTDARHRVRFYGTYDVPLPALRGRLTFGVLQAWDTGTPYGALGYVRSAAYVKDPGYLTPPTSVPYYFTPRDAYRLEDVFSTDLSLTCSWRIAGAIDLYVAPQVYNLFNSQHVIAVNTAVNTRPTNPSLAAFDPFTTRPVECPQGQTSAQCKAMGASWQKGALFGQPTSPAGYQPARTFQVAVGIRF